MKYYEKPLSNSVVEYKCAHCSKTVWISKCEYKVDKPNFCSVKCCREFNGRVKHEYICAQCGVEFKAYVNRKTNKHRCCSQKCAINFRYPMGRKIGTKPYILWGQIRARCYNTKSRDYKNWGGRGIRVSEKFNDYYYFLAYIKTLPKYDAWLNNTEKLSLDRINNNGHYEEGNLRFATDVEQGANRRFLAKSNTGIRGVSYSKRIDRFLVRIKRNTKTICIGQFKILAEAIEAKNKYFAENNITIYE